MKCACFFLFLFFSVINSSLFLFQTHLTRYDISSFLFDEKGQYQESLLLVQKSLSIQIFHYGDSSIEVARERLKLAQLLVNAMKPDLAFQEVQKGLPILELLANRMDDDLVEMKRLDTNLQEMGFK